jgi:enoyl-CoA hydratase/carnithine racemase
MSAASASDEILFEVKDDGIAWLTFNRPDARNAMTFNMYTRLGEICSDLDPRVKVLILRGAGDKAFVSGTDIAQFRKFTEPHHALDYEAMMDKVFDALEDVKVPTIAAIQGACTGGGAGIAAACDLRYGAPSARFGFPIARTLGNTLSMRNHARLAGLIGVAKTKDILFLARLMDAAEMKSIGLLNEVTSEDGLYKRVEEVAHTLMEHAPLTLLAAKEALNRVLRHWTPPGGGADFVVRNYMSKDFKEGVESFLAKRKPRWTGK